MNQLVYEKIRRWRQEKADLEKCELYRIFQNKTLDAIATLLPKTKDELLAVKGIRERKFERYGKDILAIVNECLGNNPKKISSQEKEKTYTVSSYLDSINLKLSEVGMCKIKGEVSSVSFKGHLYFSLKDKDDGSVLSCFMWAKDYEICGVEIKEGMELTVNGFSEIYKPSGRLSFRTKTIELVGEGALKKAYEELKKKLESEGLFEEARKKPIPEYPQRIGLITSRDGAVINDFMSNIGRFGFHITFFDSRVEGIMAVKDLIGAVRYFEDKSIDLLVIIRGGGSLESLQAFNNEALIREIIKLPMPVLCGIGHDKDVPLLSYVADKAVSTPSILVKEINKSWEKIVDKLNYCEKTIISSYEGTLKDNNYKLESVSAQMKDFYENIFRKFEQYQQAMESFANNISQAIRHEKYRIQKIEEELLAGLSRNLKESKYQLENVSVRMKEFYENIFRKFEQCQQAVRSFVNNISQAIRHEKYRIQKIEEELLVGFNRSLSITKEKLDNFERELYQNNHERQLKLGYSIVTLNGKVVKSASQIKRGDILISKFGQGKVQSEAQEIFNN